MEDNIKIDLKHGVLFELKYIGYDVVHLLAVVVTILNIVLLYFNQHLCSRVRISNLLTYLLTYSMEQSPS